MNNNIPTLMCDFYKISHRVQYPKNTQLVYSNLTARSDKYNQCANSEFYDKKFTWFGLRYFLINLNEIFNNHFFNKPIEECTKEYARVIKYCLNDNNPDTTHIEALHKLGYLPLEIKALPELARVDFGIPVLTIKNTSPDFFWLTNFIETWLSSDLWLLSNSASIAYEYNKICTEYAKNTCDNDDHVQFQCHDFSFRGMAGRESATISGMGHLTAFKGTDTIPAIIAMEKYYNKNIETELIGCSIPASEHSVMCAGGKDDEYNTYKRFITELYPHGLVSIVSDTWDFWAVLNDILPRLKNEIMARDGKLVIRPDSGDPVDIICGLDTYDDLTNYNERKGAIELLWDLFGGTINGKGYKVLDSHIGLIYGDSITIERCQEILKRLQNKGFASSNVVFGIGSYTYQYNTRDSMGWAVKATYCEIDNKPMSIYKQPKTDAGKNSAKGLLKVIKLDNNYVLLENQELELTANSITDELELVYNDGVIIN
jgi:nicotinamide phosphoribosyltransferase